MSELEIWKDTAGGNDASPPDGAPENMLRSGINDVLREMMAKLKRYFDAGDWLDAFYWETVSRDDATTIRVAGKDVTHILTTDRRVKITDTSGPTTVYGYVTSSSYVDPDTTAVIEVDASGSIPVNADKMEVSMAALGRSAFKNDGSGASQHPLGSQLAASIAANISAASAALIDYASSFGEAGKVPLYDQLGTVAEYDVGTASGEVPSVADLPDVLGELAVEDKNRAREQLSSTFSTSGSSLQAVTGLDNIAIPGANGSKYYEVTIEAWIADGGGSYPTEFSLRMGSTGDQTDAKVVDIPCEDVPHWPLSGSADYRAILLRYRIQPSTGDKLTIAIDPTSIYTAYVYAPSFIVVEELLES